MKIFNRFWYFLFGSGWGKKREPQKIWQTTPDLRFNCRCAVAPIIKSIDQFVIVARSEGGNAFLQGVSFGRNPHNSNVKISMAWNYGWLSARDRVWLVRQHTLSQYNGN